MKMLFLLISIAQVGVDIRDIRGPIPAPSIWLWVIGVLVAIALLTLLWVFWRMWRHKISAKPKRYDQIALESLEGAALFIGTNHVREFSFAVSDILRTYIETRFAVEAANRTTEEFLYGILDQPGSPLLHHSELLTDFLKHCDLAKFGRGELTQPQMRDMLQSARNFVLGTALPEEEKLRSENRQSKIGNRK